MSDLSTSERQRILCIATQLLVAGPADRTSFSLLASQAGMSEQRLRHHFSDWPQVALAAFVDRVGEGPGPPSEGSPASSPLERVLAAAEDLLQAADAHRALLRVAMQGPATAVWRELAGLFEAPGPFSQVGEDLELATTAGELPNGSAAAAQDVIISSVLGLIAHEVAGSAHGDQRSRDLVQGGLLFGLSHLATLERQRGSAARPHREPGIAAKRVAACIIAD